MGNANFVYKHFLKPAQGEMSSLSLLKAKNEEKVQKNLGFLDQVKNQFAHFGSPNKNSNIFNFELSFLRLFF